MRELTVAALQLSFGPEAAVNVDRVEAAVREAAHAGASLILPPELFETPYFPKEENDRYFALARPVEGHPTVERFRSLARELGAVIPVSIYELAGHARFNSVVMVDADGSVLGVYRKSHIPDGPGYSEKFYFSPGDTGFKVWDTAAGRVGLAICWDQWFPEAARVLALGGAEILCYPTAIGSEPQDATVDSSGAWTRVMQGHAAANVMPVIAANRHGREEAPLPVTFYGSSFIADHEGELVAHGPRDADAVLLARFDLDAIAESRASWGLFRDRRPELYGPLRTLDGRI